MKNQIKALAMGLIMATLVGCSTYQTGIRAVTRMNDNETNKLSSVVKITEAKSRAQSAQATGFLQWLWTPAYPVYPMGGFISPPPYGNGGRAYGGNIYLP